MTGYLKERYAVYATFIVSRQIVTDHIACEQASHWGKKEKNNRNRRKKIAAELASLADIFPTFFFAFFPHCGAWSQATDHSSKIRNLLSLGRGLLPYKRLMGMFRRMESHFPNWIDYNGVAFSKELKGEGEGTIWARPDSLPPPFRTLATQAIHTQGRNTRSKGGIVQLVSAQPFGAGGSELSEFGPR